MEYVSMQYTDCGIKTQCSVPQFNSPVRELFRKCIGTFYREVEKLPEEQGKKFREKLEIQVK